MICRPEEAKNFKCCVMDKQCEGAACMAWRQEVRQSVDLRKSQFPSPPRLEETGRGYCGLAGP